MSVELSPDDIRLRIDTSFEFTTSRLADLVRIPSVSAANHDEANLLRSAEETGAWLEDAGLREVRVLGDIPGAHPAVYGFTPGPSNTPTVLLYAHHDVQPAGPRDLWNSDPFEPVERDGRLFGRGTADDKAGIAAHAAALKVWEGKPPVSVAVFVEGEEEIASRHVKDFLREYADLLRADVIVLADFSNMRVGTPTLTTSLRGIADFLVEVRTLDHAVHSGAYGGPVPDALIVLSRLIASLHDDNGDVAVPGLVSGPFCDVEVNEAQIRQSAGVRPGITLLGTGPLPHRLWGRPAIAVLGIDAPPTESATHQLAPSARAKISVRLAPGDNIRSAQIAIDKHLKGKVPWGAEISVTPLTEGAPHFIKTSGVARQAFRRACEQTWGRPPVEPGSGGSLPFVAALAEALPEAELLLTGVADPDSHAHAENESVHLGDLKNCCASEAALLAELAALS